jgi:NAD(P)-dependent dehydrogenase (short-subunit alcohol dehydrogenase family)
VEAALSNRVALVTGGGRGIGRAIAERLARDGARVAVMSRTADELESTVRLIDDAGGSAMAVRADVCDYDAVKRACADVTMAFGPIEILINNAGAGGAIGPLWELDPDEWWQTLVVNLRGAVNCAHVALPSMVRDGRGRIINIASNAGAHRWPFLSAYAVAKAGLIKLTENLASETRAHGVSVFAVHPGTVNVGPTKALLEADVSADPIAAKVKAWFQSQIEQGSDVTPAEAAELVAALASGYADQLSGRYISIEDSLPELVAGADEIKDRDLHVLKLNRPTAG